MPQLVADKHYFSVYIMHFIYYVFYFILVFIFCMELSKQEIEPENFTLSYRIILHGSCPILTTLRCSRDATSYFGGGEEKVFLPFSQNINFFIFCVCCLCTAQVSPLNLHL